MQMQIQIQVQTTNANANALGPTGTVWWRGLPPPDLRMLMYRPILNYFMLMIIITAMLMLNEHCLSFSCSISCPCSLTSWWAGLGFTDGFEKSSADSVWQLLLKYYCYYCYCFCCSWGGDIASGSGDTDRSSGTIACNYVVRFLNYFFVWFGLGNLTSSCSTSSNSGGPIATTTYNCHLHITAACDNWFHTTATT